MLFVLEVGRVSAGLNMTGCDAGGGPGDESGVQVSPPSVVSRAIPDPPAIALKLLRKFTSNV